MKDISKEIEYRGKNYKIVFNLNVMQVIQERFGTVEAWGEAMSQEKGKEPKASDIIYGFWAMLNEGIDIDNEDKPENERIAPLTLKQVGRMLTEVGINGAAAEMKNLVVESTKGDDSKNA